MILFILKLAHIFIIKLQYNYQFFFSCISVCISAFFPFFADKLIFLNQFYSSDMFIYTLFQQFFQEIVNAVLIKIRSCSDFRILIKKKNIHSVFLLWHSLSSFFLLILCTLTFWKYNLKVVPELFVISKRYTSNCKYTVYKLFCYD